MTRNEFNDLHEKMCYGHDAELLIEGGRYFFEWNEATISVYKMNGEVGDFLFDVSGRDRFDVIDRLFATPIVGKTISSDFSVIQVLDVE